jgi:SRSO17 transposase
MPPVSTPVGSASADPLDRFVAEVFASLPRRDQRRWAATYLRGLLIDAPRKSVRTMCDHLRDADEQALQQFVNQSPWDPGPVRRRLAIRVARELQPTTWVVQEFVIPKTGTASAGVQRAYVPKLGRTIGCQLGVVLAMVRPGCALPVNWRLALPRCWAQDAERRLRARVPPEEQPWPSWRLALQMIDDLLGWGVEPVTVLVDAPATPALCTELDARQLYHVVQEPSWGHAAASTTRHTAFVLRKGAEGRSRFVASLAGEPPGWTLLEWPLGSTTPVACWRSNLPPRATPQAVARVTRTTAVVEAMLAELRDEVGLEDFSGRSWSGWHHHVTLVSACQAFRELARSDVRLAPGSANGSAHAVLGS